VVPEYFSAEKIPTLVYHIALPGEGQLDAVEQYSPPASTDSSLHAASWDVS
jgi:hypothetical protein